MPVYSPWLVSEGRPDTSSVDRFVNSPPFAGKKDEDLAVELWKYFSSSEVGIFHYCPPEENFRKREVHDIIAILNCFGFAICHIHAHILGQAYQAAGYPARIGVITGHEGTEIFYANGWHYLDCDLKGYSRCHPPRQHCIASREELYKDPTIVTDQKHPSEPHYYVPDRPPARIAELAASPPEYLDVLDEVLHSMDFVLRPGESITRYFAHSGRWIIFPQYRWMWKKYTSEPGPEGPTERFEPYRQWGNGEWVYAPRMERGCRDLEEGACRITGLERTDSGLAARPGAGPGRAEFDFDLPYPIAGIPDPNGTLTPHSGALVTLTFNRATPADAIRLKLSFDSGRTWKDVWDGFQRGRARCTVDLTPFLEGRYRFRLMVVLEASRQVDAAVELTGLEVRLHFMSSPYVLPAVRPGRATVMTYRSRDRYGFRTGKTRLEVDLADPEAFQAVLHSSDNLKYDAQTAARTIPADPAAGPWSVTFRLEAPEDGTMAWLYANGVWEGRLENEPAQACLIEVRDGDKGDWQTVCACSDQVHPKRWHSIRGGEIKLSGSHTAAYIRYTSRKGLAAFRIAGHYIPARAEDDPGEPLEIIHAWREKDRTRKHKEKIPSGCDAHAYRVEAGPDAKNVSVTMRVGSRKKKRG